jgi:hypothetical protein
MADKKIVQTRSRRCRSESFEKGTAPHNASFSDGMWGRETAGSIAEKDSVEQAAKSRLTVPHSVNKPLTHIASEPRRCQKSRTRLALVAAAVSSYDRSPHPETSAQCQIPRRSILT